MEFFNRRAPIFSRIITMILKKNSMQERALVSFLETCDDEYWDRAEYAVSLLGQHLESRGENFEIVADAYIKMCKEMLVEQLYFAKTGTYRLESDKVAFDTIYSLAEEMDAYILGLALSQFLWKNHYAIFNFFIAELEKLDGIENYLEVGAGHGLYLIEALKRLDNLQATVVDISQTSINMCKNLVKLSALSDRCDFLIQDVRDFSTNQYDFIAIGEVLEHIDNPESVLNKIFQLLKKDGLMFVTTCANCPAIDHIYLYENQDDIERQLNSNGFEILRYVALPISNLPSIQGQKPKVGLNYAALCRKTN